MYVYMYVYVHAWVGNIDDRRKNSIGYHYHPRFQGILQLTPVITDITKSTEPSHLTVVQLSLNSRPQIAFLLQSLEYWDYKCRQQCSFSLFSPGEWDGVQWWYVHLHCYFQFPKQTEYTK